MLKLKAHVVISMLILTIATQNLFGITVTSNLDPGTTGPGTATCVGTDTGSGLTLREAIEIVNMGGTDKTIEFDLPAGKETIFLCSLLPIITEDDVIIDGANTIGSGVQVTIDESYTTFTADPYGLRFNGASNVIIKNIAIVNIATGLGINNNIIALRLDNSPNSLIENVSIRNLRTIGGGAPAEGVVLINSGITTIHTVTISELSTAGVSFSDINAIRVANSDDVTIGGPGGEAVIIENITAEGSIVRGIFFSGSNNGVVENAIIGNLSTTMDADDVYGILGDANSSLSTILDCDMGNLSATNEAHGIFVSTIIGDCSSNRVSSILAESISSGIRIAGIDGDCSNNIISSVSSSSNESFGILINVMRGDMVACNSITNISGDTRAVGLSIGGGSELVIGSNIVDSLESFSSAAYGITLGQDGLLVSDSIVSFNNVSNVLGSEAGGFGIALFGPTDQSVGNDILSNSIFNINGKAISIIGNGVPVDASIFLRSVSCADGCKLVVKGTLIPMIDAPEFKLQLFVSDTDVPLQAKTLVAEKIINFPSTLSSTWRFSGISPDVTFGKYITITATAIFDGLLRNNNTSEVSNALPACEPSGNVCQCADEIPLPEPPLCPLS